MAYVGSAWGKLLLFGEHAAVYGYPAVGIALPESLRIEINPGKTKRPNFSPQQEPTGSLAAPFESMIRALESLFPPVSAAGVLDRLRGGVRIVSTIPQSLGYGSSAALCSAFSRAALEVLGDVGIVASEQDVWRIANTLERVFHGTPSGIDTGLATLGGLQAFYFGTADLPSATPLPPFTFSMVTGAVPRESSTKTLIGGFRARLESGDRTLRDQMAALGRSAEEGIEVIRDPSADHPREIGRIATGAHTLLREMGLSTEALETAIDAGLEAGSTGGKLSGAGGGGAFYLLFADTDGARGAFKHIKNALKRYPDSDRWPLRVFESEDGAVRRVAA